VKYKYKRQEKDKWLRKKISVDPKKIRQLTAVCKMARYVVNSRLSFARVLS
jgi:hypothetical protein